VNLIIKVTFASQFRRHKVWPNSVEFMQHWCTLAQALSVGICSSKKRREQHDTINKDGRMADPNLRLSTADAMY
jgi:hypothetical protein